MPMADQRGGFSPNFVDVGRRSLLAQAAALVATAPLAALAQDSAPLRWVVPFPPGGGSDLATRILAKRLGEALARPVIVDNKPGAATMLAAQEVARAKPDGNTLLTAGMSTLTLNPGLYGTKLPYQPDKDFAHVSTLVRLPVVLVVHPQNPARDLKELLAWLKQQGNKASYASTGPGTPHHVTMALWLEQNNLETIHVPYKGMPQALQDLAGGQFAMMFGDMAASAPLIKAGRLKAIAVPSRQRSKVLPDVPTFAEAGMPYEAAAWQGVVMPAGTPTDVVERYSSIIRAALLEAAIVEQLAHHGVEPLGSTPQEFSRFAAAERSRWTRIIQANRISAE